MKQLLIYLYLFVFNFLSSETKHFTRCDLVHELRRQLLFPEYQMRDYKYLLFRVCLIEHESVRHTDIVSTPNKNGSRDHGLFQINDNLWCSNTTLPGKGCHVTCTEIATDDITKASICAKRIFNIQGFLAWHGWENFCQKDLPDIINC